METRMAVSRKHIKWIPCADPNLIAVAVDLVRVWPQPFVWVTSFYRAGDDGVHGTVPIRGMDVRHYGTRPGALAATKADGADEAAKYAASVNALWEYDHKRPNKVVAFVEDDHLHLQVHENTKRR